MASRDSGVPSLLGFRNAATRNTLMSGMICFRVIFWGLVLIFLMLPGAFLVGIIGRIAGFRPGSKPGTVETVFGWFGIIALGGIMVGGCVIAGLIDYAVATAVEQGGPGGFQQPNQNLVAVFK